MLSSFLYFSSFPFAFKSDKIKDTAERLLITETPETRDEWILAIRRLLGDMWQALLESMRKKRENVRE